MGSPAAVDETASGRRGPLRGDRLGDDFDVIGLLRLGA